MLTGIEVMLKRMETHPEEFVGVNGGCTPEWHRAFTNVAAHLTDEEKTAVSEALTKAHRDFFNGEAMRIMSGERSTGDGRVTARRQSIAESLQKKFSGANTVTLPYNPAYEAEYPEEERMNQFGKRLMQGVQIKGEGQPVSYE